MASLIGLDLSKLPFRQCNFYDLVCLSIDLDHANCRILSGCTHGPLPDYSNDQLVFLMLAIFRELSHRVGVTVSPVDMVFERLDQPEAWAHNSSRLQMQQTLHPRFVIWRLQILMMKAVLAYHPGVLLKKTLTMIPCLEHHAKRAGGE